MHERFRTHLKTGESHQMPANQAVEGILRALRFDPQLYAVFEIWDKETKTLVRGCEATAIQGSRLVVTVPSAAHRQELMYSKERILSRVNQAMGRRVITDIQFEFSKGGN
ncbi:MAG: hypothetical protein KCHDKBKB_01869 [Elusimicrobia bacterium]|nr:hypothetical protein [Elusimicrobiota bacterium]